jgi:DNA-binding CsgD family transcriptional regulator
MSETARTGRGTLGLDLSWVKGYLDLIASGVSVEQLLRRSHEEIGSFHPIAFSQIFAFDREGHLAPKMTFGLPHESQHGLSLAKDDLHPVTDCARTEDTLAIPSHSEYLNRYPSVQWGNGPSIYVPLRVGPLVDGVFAMVFRRDHSIEWSENLELQEAIYVIAQLAHLIGHRGSLAMDSSSTVDPSLSLGLSDRQMVIAKMIAQGMTNRTIAKELGFSEATIRYETIKLYERLRVKNRSHAAARIHQLGIG